MSSESPEFVTLVDVEALGDNELQPPRLPRTPKTTKDYDRDSQARSPAPGLPARPTAARNFSFPFNTQTLSPSRCATPEYTRVRRDSSIAPLPSLLESGSTGLSPPSRIDTPEVAFKPELHAARTAALHSFRFRVNLGREEIIRENKQTLINYLKSYDWDPEEAARHYDQRIARIQASRGSWDENEEFKKRWTAMESINQGKKIVNKNTTTTNAIEGTGRSVL